MGPRTSTPAPTGARDGGPARTRGRVPARTPHRAPGRSSAGDPRRDGPTDRPATTTQRRWFVVVALVSVLVGAAAALVLRAALTAPSDLERDVAALEAAETERDAGLARDLVASAGTAHAQVLAVVTEVESATADGASPTAEQATAWTNEVVAAAAPFSEQVSGGTRVNLTREGFRHATDLLAQSLRTHRDAAQAGADAPALRAAAEESFRSGLVAWSIAATELDELALATDLGHVHLYLTDDPSTGAITSHDGDHEGEGTP